MTVIEQMISKFIRTQQSSNVLCYTRVDPSRPVTGRANQLFLKSMFDENAAWIGSPYVARGGQKDEKKTFCMFVVAAVLSVFFFAATLSTQKNRIKNYGIFFLCKLPPLIKYATDKVKKEFLSCTNDQVFVFWLRGERFSLNRRNQRQDQRRSR